MYIINVEMLKKDEILWEVHFLHKHFNINVFIGGCGFMNKENNKEAEIKKILIKH